MPSSSHPPVLESTTPSSSHPPVLQSTTPSSSHPPVSQSTTPSQSGPGGGSTYSYYISNAGHDDTGDGSIGNPWATLTKVNSLSLLPSTTVYFRRGDTFVGTLTVSASGSPGKPIIFDAYGSGGKSYYNWS